MKKIIYILLTIISLSSCLSTLYPERFLNCGTAETWPERMAELKEIHQNKILSVREISYLAEVLWREFPVETDWFICDNNFRNSNKKQGTYDFTGDIGFFLRNKNDKYLINLLNNANEKISRSDLKADFSEKIKTLDKQIKTEHTTELLELYTEICKVRRTERLKTLTTLTDEVIFVKHQSFGCNSGIYLITETEYTGQKSGIFSIKLKKNDPNLYLEQRPLFEDQKGMFRDPELSYDNKKLLFSWWKNPINTFTREEDAPENNYKIFELNLESNSLRQLTTDKTYGADFEAAYLPDGNIMFSSARILQHITCGWGDCSNLFIMNKDGKYQRRVGFDQTNTSYPRVLNDGRIVYTRRDYNDRGQVYAHSLFSMFCDGTMQREFYGNNTIHPTSYQHTRPIPGEKTKVVSIIGGYHTTQGGKPVIIDIAQGTQNLDGITDFFTGDKPVITKSIGDHYAKEGSQFAYPFPLNKTSMLVSMQPVGGWRERDGVLRYGYDDRRLPYSIYWIDNKGNRELLIHDKEVSSMQPVPRIIREQPPVVRGITDYSKQTATCYVENVYTGAAAVGIKPGDIKKLRVVEITYKPTTIGGARMPWPEPDKGGYGHSVTPVSLSNGTYDVKVIHGDVEIDQNGNALFEVPARKPLYFQLLDSENRVIQTMRSWANFMPGEFHSCVGCHEKQYDAPESNYSMMQSASAGGIKKLSPFYGQPRGFSFEKEIQPILDKNCISCHNSKSKKGGIILDNKKTPNLISARMWSRSYLTLTGADFPRLKPLNPRKYEYEGPIGKPGKYADWITRLTEMPLQPPYRAGAITSPLYKMLKNDHKNIRLSSEALDKIAAWMDLNVPYCGEYDENRYWNLEQSNRYYHKMELRKKMAEFEQTQINQMLQDESY